jgi:hypothetical protein
MDGRKWFWLESGLIIGFGGTKDNDDCEGLKGLGKGGRPWAGIVTRDGEDMDALRGLGFGGIFGATGCEGGSKLDSTHISEDFGFNLGKAGREVSFLLH